MKKTNTTSVVIAIAILALTVSCGKKNQKPQETGPGKNLTATKPPENATKGDVKLKWIYKPDWMKDGAELAIGVENDKEGLYWSKDKTIKKIQTLKDLRGKVHLTSEVPLYSSPVSSLHQGHAVLERAKHHSN